MHRTALLFIIIALFTSGMAFAQTATGNAGLIPPPAIHLPYGGTVVTEINLTDNDVLGIIKQVIPAISDAAGIESATSEVAEGSPIATINKLDLKSLAAAIDGIKAIRVVVAKYPKALDPQKVIAQFSNGVAKLGSYTKVASDFAFAPGVVGLYAGENNSGYVGFMYNPKERTMYAARVVGFVDVQKLVAWAVHVGNTMPELTDKLPPMITPQETPNEEIIPGSENDEDPAVQKL